MTSNVRWEPVPSSLEYDLVTYASTHGEIPVEYRICRAVPDAGVMPSEVKATIEFALNTVLRDYAEGLIVEHPPVIRERVNATLAWLEQQPTVTANDGQA